MDYAVPHQLCTRIENHDGVGVNTIEHFMAAFHGLGIDNLLIEVDGPEMPILDGSSTMIIGLLTQAGLQEQTEARQVLVIVDDVEIDLGTENMHVYRLMISLSLTSALILKIGLLDNSH